MRLSSAEEMMNADRKMMEEFSVPTLILMEHAALAIYSEMKKRDLLSGKIVIVCGKGNNGGDGYVLARILYNNGYDVSIVNAFSMVPGSRDAEINYKICRNINIPFVDKSYLFSADVIVDALFGIGMNNRLNDFCSDIIKTINSTDAYVVSVDLPSGAYGDSVFQKNICVQADLTITFAAYKSSLLFYPSAYNCGEVVCCDIGIYDNCFSGNAYVTDFEYLKKALPERPKHGHKGTFGKLLCIGGSNGMSGAVFMNGEGALRSGCGIVKLCVPESISHILETKTTEVMTVSCPDDGLGSFSEVCIGEIIKNASEADAIIFGSGIGRMPAITAILDAVLSSVNVPVIIDADGIYALSRNRDMLKTAQCPIILTPHLGEMSALTGLTISDFEGEPIELARKFSKEYDAVICLKSSRTVIASPDGRVFVNTFGNSGLAKGGSGDVLAGIIGSFAALGTDVSDAAVCATAILGIAADITADELTEFSVTPLEVTKNIGKAIKKCNE